MSAWCGEVDIGERYELLDCLILKHLQTSAQTQDNALPDRIAGLREQTEGRFGGVYPFLILVIKNIIHNVHQHRTSQKLIHL